MKAKQRLYYATTLALAAFLMSLETSFSQSTAFTYQGQLTESGQPATGRYDLKFALYEVPTGGVALGAVTNVATEVSNGCFTVTLDFGDGVFTGAARWLELGAVTNGGGAFNPLSPRQAVTATPYAVRALTVSSNALADYAGAVALLNPANTFVGSFGGDGSSVSNVNATTVGGLTASNFWQLGGNAGTTAGTHFVGTTDNQPLELRVNGARAFRLEPTAGVPNVIGGGTSNSVSEYSYGATISGGDQNSIASGGNPNSYFRVMQYGTIGGGQSNRMEQFFVSGSHGTIAGGRNNTITGSPDAATIGGGRNNKVGGGSSVVAGGSGNWVSGFYGAIGGGSGNSIDSWDGENFASLGGVIAGGRGNRLGYYVYDSAIGGGNGNNINGSEASAAVIAGGSGNKIMRGSSMAIGGGSGNFMDQYASYSFIGGGLRNSVGIQCEVITIGGGWSNSVSGYEVELATISGGYGNVIKSGGNTTSGANWGASIGGGMGNAVHAGYATVNGGLRNLIHTNAQYAAISGGLSNEIRNAYDGKRVDPAKSVISGGASNVLYEAISVISGGALNTIGQTNSRRTDGGHVIAGGSANWITSSNMYSSIGGGLSNGVDAAYATIAGGYSNRTVGNYAMIAGGEQNAATTHGFAAGRRAKANHAGAFVWADATDADLVSTNENSVTMRAAGGYRLYSDSAEAAGVYLAEGGGSWTSISDRNAKENFRPVDVEAVLSKVAALPLSFWNYKTQDEAIQHLGPMAQDFRAAFGLGESATGITTIDADGVALAAIQGLHQKLTTDARQKDREIAELKQELADLKQLVEKLARSGN